MVLNSFSNPVRVQELNVFTSRLTPPVLGFYDLQTFWLIYVFTALVLRLVFLSKWVENVHTQFVLNYSYDPKAGEPIRVPILGKIDYRKVVPGITLALTALISVNTIIFTLMCLMILLSFAVNRTVANRGGMRGVDNVDRHFRPFLMNSNFIYHAIICMSFIELFVFAYIEGTLIRRFDRRHKTPQGKTLVMGLASSVLMIVVCMYISYMGFTIGAIENSTINNFSSGKVAPFPR
jgi:hypothetical protein